MAFKETMIPLQSQEQFERLRASSLKLKNNILIYFTAKWCGPCRAFNWESIKGEFAGYNIFICDVDENTYTPGFCGVRSIPSFLIIKTDSSVVGPKQTSDPANLVEWLKESS